MAFCTISVDGCSCRRKYCIWLLFLLWVLLWGMVVGLTRRGWLLLYRGFWEILTVLAGYPETAWVLEEGAGVFLFLFFVFYKDPQCRWSKFTLWETSCQGLSHCLFSPWMDLKQQESTTRILWPHSMINVMLPQSIKLTFSFSSIKALKTKLISFITDKVKHILHLIFTKIVTSIFAFTILLWRVKHFLIMHP